MYYFKKTIFPVFLCLLAFLACRESPRTVQDKPSETKTTEVLIEAESFTDSKGAFAIEDCAEGGKQIISPDEEGWIAFSADISVAGRYQTQVRVSSQSGDSTIFWVEDHTDNQDDRTYNITSSMILDPTAGDGFQTLSKDGSPLNKGTHQIRLHVGKGVAAVNWVKFTLMKEHQLTPNNMTQNHEGETWEVVWADEFDQDGYPDSTKWTYDIGDWGWGNGELQYYTEKRLQNARVENGHLIIEAHKNDMGSPWTSARLTTRGKVSFLYGKIEFRAKVPVEKGNWAAGWTLGDDYRDELSWPYCGEIDILETVGYELDDVTGDGKAHASAHCGAYYFKLGNQPTGITEVKNMKEEWHTYAVDWTPDYIKAYVDGEEYFTYDDNSTALSWPFDKAQNLILNLAMGGGWGGLQGMDETVTSQQFILDYVRVYERR
jgi:beta-glucanase (GH16 family)